MVSNKTLIAIAAVAVGTAAAAGVTLGPALWIDAAAEPVALDRAPGTREAQLARLAEDPDIAPELIELVRALQRDLQAQQAAQLQLAAQLAELQRARSVPEGAANTDARAAADQNTDAASEPSTGEDPAARWWRGGGGPASEERLIEAGFAAGQARQLLSRVDAVAMERLNLQYQAVRDGWMGTDRYREALSALPDLREIVTTEFGDDAYDRYLYATGRPNRLVVRDVLKDSPATSAGLQPGDRVLAMDNQRIYSTRDLMSIASAGSEGETVPLVVERGDAVFEVYVPRGPLGIRGGRGFENPANP